jgi:hypothetical protein
MHRAFLLVGVQCLIGVGCHESTVSTPAPECDLLLYPEVTIGANAGPEGPSLRSRVVRSDGLYFVLGTFNPGQVSVFDSKGDYIHSIGSQGRGPGENMEVEDIAVSGDTLYVYDSLLRRIQAYDVNGAFLGVNINLTEQASIAPAPGGGLLLLRATTGGAAKIERLAGERVIRTLEVSNESTRLNEKAGAYMAEVGESIWVAFIRRYEFERYTYDGKRLNKIKGNSPYFPSGISRAEWAELDSIALIADIAVDSKQRLLTLHVVRSLQQTSETNDQRDQPEVEPLRSVIELFHPITGRLLARHVAKPSRFVGLADPYHVYALTENAGGTPLLEVFRIYVVEPNSKEVCQWHDAERAS